MYNLILQGDALTMLKSIPSDSVDCCVTSPPYYRLRDYGVEGQIGLESTVQEYIDKLTAVFREVKRVLKSGGTLWVNIMDCYAGSGKGKGQTTPLSEVQSSNKGILSIHKYAMVAPESIEVKPKDLIGVPWLLAFALRADGWYWRQVDIWEKPNCMPESVTDRCTNSHEYILMFAKSRRYYFDYAAIREPCVTDDKSSPRGSRGALTPNAGRRQAVNRKTFRGGGAYTNNKSFDNMAHNENASHGNVPNEEGLRRKRSVWSVSSVGSKFNHYATFPQKLIKPCILAGCPQGGVVLDCFAGTGTTGVMAQNSGRGYILIELAEDNINICRNRLKGVKHE